LASRKWENEFALTERRMVKLIAWLPCVESAWSALTLLGSRAFGLLTAGADLTGAGACTHNLYISEFYLHQLLLQ